MEANEPSLKDRREKLSLQFCTKQKSNRSNPTYNTVFRPNFFSLFEKKPNAILSFESPQHLLLQALKLEILKQLVIDAPPWTLNKPEVNFSLLADKKDNTDAFIFKTKFQRNNIFLPRLQAIYTDGSKDGPKVAAACVLGHKPENAVYLIMHLFSLQKAKPLIWLWIT